MFIDTHCHLNMMVKKPYDAPLSEKHFSALEKELIETRDAGVEKIITVGTTLPETYNCIALAKRFDSVFATAGIHPCDAAKDWRGDFKEITRLIKDKERNKIVAVGECGLDFYHEPYFKQRQIDVFKAHIDLALKYELPLSIHVREASDELLFVLEEYKGVAKGVIHCFQQDVTFADMVLEWGFYVGLDAPIGYSKNQELQNVVADIPLERILLETDAPFLSPKEFRGSKNSPKYIPLIAQDLAKIKNVSLDEVARVTTENAKKVFRLIEWMT